MDFKEWIKSQYANKKSGTASSYIVAVRIIDEMLKLDGRYDITSVTDIEDEELLGEVSKYVCKEQKAYKKGEPSIFANVSAKQCSYPSKGFCSASMKKVIEYRKELNNN